MFIKVKANDGHEFMLNADNIISITPLDETLSRCRVECVDDCSFEVSQPFNQLEYMLQANSIEKEIDRLKVENMQTAMRMQYDEIHSSIYGGKRK
jgi:hypothetical protein